MTRFTTIRWKNDKKSPFDGNKQRCIAGTIAAYRKDGHFLDGTVLIKEAFKTTANDMTAGTASSAGPPLAGSSC